jgi:NTE family protein
MLVMAGHAFHAQKVGVVLSGGGATAMSHIGFLKALEENNIPIDYLVGTSMGAIVASYYAAGFTIAEMDSLVRLPEFQKISEGGWPEEFRFFYLEKNPDPSMVNLKYSGGDKWSNSLPTNLIDPNYMDWNHMRTLSQANALAEEDFNNLFIPFRSVASDVMKQEEYIFRSGNLNEAIRTSATYPFFIPPIRVNNRLLYDGGIYNNFPIDVMYQEFSPDVIIGCNVSDELDEADENDLVSQLEALIVTQKEVVLPCNEIIVVKPNLKGVSTFDFAEVASSIDSGYVSTLRELKRIQGVVNRRVSANEVQVRRKEFRSKLPEFQVGNIQIDGVKKRSIRLERELMGKGQNSIHIDDLKKKYFRLLKEGEVRSIYPLANWNKTQKNFNLNLKVKSEKDLLLSFGGNYSSRSISSGFIGLRYNNIGNLNFNVEANSYYGRFYGSAMARVQGRFFIKNFPLQTALSFTQNRWDYYKSISTFFEDVKPSFILLNERFAEASISAPAGTKGKLTFDALYTYQYDEYYQTRNFLSVDTADMTQLGAAVLRFSYERNSLNRVQYASSGSRFLFSSKWVKGTENTIPGTTSLNRDTISNSREWYIFRGLYENYFIQGKVFSFGGRLEGVYSNLPKFQNYTATLINCPTIHGFPEFSTFFMPQFRAPRFVSFGISPVFHFSKSVDFRMDLFAFHPILSVIQKPVGTVGYFKNSRTFTTGSASVVFHSPIGPISISSNYYEQNENPWSFLLNIGFILNNKSSRD